MVAKAQVTSIAIPYHLRREVAAYCSHAISPQRYYLHNAIGGIGWSVSFSTQNSKEWIVEASDEHLIMLRLKLGV